ncbi:MAG: nucleotidyl transferase AbiEii/AbiGii toxin family protein [Chitinispirillaceae bacterium]|nr:nucleotidyl transferase AbiEii/AbiGii toxin family protein [Chitinispirillaceae bacterium]
MAQKQIKDLGASVRERLLQLSRKTDRSFDAVLRQYGQERFLYRLSISPYRTNFILKGGLLFFSLSVPVRRPTVDIDFLGIKLTDNPEKLKTVFTEIAQIACPDGIEYHPEGISINQIKKETDFTGSRIIIPAILAKARVNLQIDVAFGDVVTRGPRVFEFPTLLDLPKPSIFAYSMETMIAEKFQAIVERQTATSRMKDFFDIAYLSEVMPFDGNELHEAFSRTFAQRRAGVGQAESVFSAEFASNPGLASMWKGFLARNRIMYPDDFTIIMRKIRNFLEPVVTETCKNKMWDNMSNVWLTSKADDS